MALRIDVVTLFPEFFDSPLRLSILGRAIERGLVQVHLWNLREFAPNRHGIVDDYPYGGGPGMVLRPEPFFAAVRALGPAPGTPIILTSAAGEPLTQERVRDFASKSRLIILCGHYEGVDERVCEALVTDEISIGDYVLSGGEPAALVLIDAVARLQKGALGDDQSAEEESYSEFLLEYPHYTRPAEFEGLKVPDQLRRGDHAAVRRWRRKQALRRTLLRRPDVLARAELSDEDRQLLAEIVRELSEQAAQ